jgi:hypothetical protein
MSLMPLTRLSKKNPVFAKIRSKAAIAKVTMAMSIQKNDLERKCWMCIVLRARRT